MSKLTPKEQSSPFTSRTKSLSPKKVLMTNCDHYKWVDGLCYRCGANRVQLLEQRISILEKILAAPTHPIDTRAMPEEM